jgi:cell division protein FtsQ
LKKREKRDKKRKKRKVSLLVKLLLTAAICTGVYFFASSSFFNVTSFEVSGNSYYSEDEILTMGNCKTGGNIFWGSGCKEIKSRLEKDAYMEKVKVKRILPDKIKIELTERRQTAAVVYGDHYAIIDNNSRVLRKSSVEPKIPLVQGLTISKLEVGQTIEIEEKVKFRQVMEILKTMEQYDMYFKKIVISESDVKAYIFDYLVCQGAPADIMEAMENEELQKVIRELFEMKIERGTIKVSGESYISFSPEIA